MKLIKVYINILLLCFSLCQIRVLVKVEDGYKKTFENFVNPWLLFKYYNSGRIGNFMSWTLYGSSSRFILDHNILSQCIKFIKETPYVMVYKTFDTRGFLQVSDGLKCSQVLTLEEAMALNISKKSIIYKLAEANSTFIVHDSSNDNFMNNYISAFSKMSSKEYNDSDKTFVLNNIAYLLKNLKNNKSHSFNILYDQYMARAVGFILSNTEDFRRPAEIFYINFTVQNLRSTFNFNNALAFIEKFPANLKKSETLIKQKVEILVLMSKFTEALEVLGESKKPYKLLMKAYVYIKNYELGSAENIFNKDETKFYGFLQYYEYKAELLILLEERSQALDLMNLLKKNFLNAKSLLNKLQGHIYRRFEEYPTALKFYRIAEELDKTDLELKPLIGLTYVYLKNYSAANKVFNDDELTREVKPSVLNYSGYAELRQVK
jgi:hypothetical protein